MEIIILFYHIRLFQFFIYQLFKAHNQSKKSFVHWKTFIEHFLYIGTVLGSGDIVVKKTMSWLPRVYTLRGRDDNQTNKQRNMQDKKS